MGGLSEFFFFTSPFILGSYVLYVNFPVLCTTIISYASCYLNCIISYYNILVFLLPNKLAACEREWIVTVDDQELTF